MSNDTSITFINTTDHKVHIYWFKEDIEEVWYYQLLPGAQYTQHTFVAHKWIIKSSQDELLRTQVAGESVQCQCVISYEMGRDIAGKETPSLKAVMNQLRTEMLCTLPSAGYQRVEIAGFIVFFEEGVFEYEPRLRNHLTADLVECRKLFDLSTTARQLMSAPRVFINKLLKYNGQPAATPCCCHWSREWLEQNGNVGEKEGCVEIYDAVKYVDWCKDQPAMLFHELCHALHWHLRNEKSDEAKRKDSLISEVYQHAVTSGVYESVQHIYGQMVRHYALTNEKEYFAECCEAFFSTSRFRNDFFPFVHRELETLDEKGYWMIANVWDVEGVQFDYACPPDYDPIAKKYIVT